MGGGGGVRIVYMCECVTVYVLEGVGWGGGSKSMCDNYFKCVRVSVLHDISVSSCEYTTVSVYELMC